MMLLILEAVVVYCNVVNVVEYKEAVSGETMREAVVDLTTMMR